ncbi:MAG: AAA family ATPase [Actinobacteria bacterium]|nr:AAA family ATPase [Actinomycetota bacterium]
MDRQIIIDDNHIDDHIDDEIKTCFNKDNLKSFFTFAGAGSGKTRSLVKTLSFLDDSIGSELAAYSKQIAVITYTNAACNEILSRVDYKHIFSVSTIHSFLWELIKNQQRDLKEWIKKSIVSEINELEEQQLRGRSGNASIERTKLNLRKIDLVKLKLLKDLLITQMVKI